MIKNNDKINFKNGLSNSWINHKMVSNRLSFFGKGITHIDRLEQVSDNVLQAIKELDFSHNVLVKIENIRQFPNLETINLAYNQIADGKQIVKLSKLNKLRKISVKGNPFIKSGEGRVQANRFLIKMKTDIEILSQVQQSQLQQCIQLFIQKQLKKYCANHTVLLTQLITQYNYKVSQNLNDPQDNKVETYRRIVDNLIRQKIEQLKSQTRYEIASSVIKIGDIQLTGYESREEFLKWFDRCLQAYNQKVQLQNQESDRQLTDKIQIFSHAVNIRKQKNVGDSSIPIFKKTKPLLSKKQNSQNLPIMQFKTIKNQQKEHQQYPHGRSLSQRRRNVSVAFPKDSYESHKMLEQKFEGYYSAMMNKYNPVYQLLYSPLHSLKSKQKDLLIQTLSKHLKEKSFSAFKGQKLKEEMIQTNAKFAQKQKNLKTAEQKLIELKIQLSQKAIQLQRQFEQKKQLLQKLNYLQENKLQLEQRVEYFQQQLSEAKLIDIKKSSQLEKFHNEQKLFETISLNRQNGIKKSYLKKIAVKATLLSRLRKTQQINKQKQQNESIKQCFQLIKSQALNKKKMNNIKVNVQNSRKKESFLKFVSSIKLQVSSSKLSKYLKKMQIENGFKLLWLNFTQSRQNKKQLNQFSCKRNTLQLLSCFREWKIQAEEERNQQRMKEVQTYYHYKLLIKMVKNWMVFTKMPIYQQAQVSVDIRTSRKIGFFDKFKNQFYSKSMIQNKFFNLIIYLNKNKRIENFFLLKKNYIESVQKRKIKQQKLVHRLRSNYLQQFLNASIILKQTKKQQRQKQSKLSNLIKKNVVGRLSKQKYVYKDRKERLRTIFNKFRKFDIIRNFKQSLKQFMIEDKRKRSEIKNFFTFLQIFYRKKLKIAKKMAMLKYKLNSNQNRITDIFLSKRSFFIQLRKPLDKKKKMVQFLNRKYYKIMSKCYNYWKIQIFRSQIQFLNKKIRQFGPQIQDISKRQKTTFEEKLVLMNIIESKQKTIKGFVKQLQQAEYTIKTKEDKYQKLKQFIHESGDEITVVGSKVQPAYLTDSFIPQRDFQTYLDEQKQYFSSFRRF